MPTSARIGYGSKFEMYDYALSGYVELGETTNIKPPSDAIDLIDATSNSSVNARREFITGLIDGGEATCEMNYVPGSATDLLCRANVARRAAAAFRITFPNSVKMAFDGVITGYEPTDPFDDKMMATLSVKVTGAVTQV